MNIVYCQSNSLRCIARLSAVQRSGNTSPAPTDVDHDCCSRARLAWIKMHNEPPPLPASLRDHYEWLLAHAAAPPTRLLDIGAGQGRLLSLARGVVRERLVGSRPQAIPAGPRPSDRARDW